MIEHKAMDKSGEVFRLRRIAPRDNAQVEGVIRSCLREFGADHEGTAWADPDLGRFSQVYATPGSAYWVAEDPEGRIVGGAGIGPLTDTVCELQKMYCLPEARGTGLARQLMDLCLTFAAEHYEFCYLETLENMSAARRFYEKCGFRRTTQPPVETPHFACDIRYIRRV